MATKIETALELKGIAYDAYSGWKSYTEGGVLKIADSILNATTVVTSFAGLFGPVSLGRDIIAFKANEIKFSLSLTELMAEANKADPDPIVVSQALLGVVSSTAGMVGAVPGVPPNIRFAANIIALAADAGKESLPQLPKLFDDLEKGLRAAGTNDWNFDPTGTGAEAIMNASTDARSAARALDDLGEIVITAGKVKAENVITNADAGRISSQYIAFGGDVHSAIIKVGGNLSDLWVLQKTDANGFAIAKEFYAAVLACNPSITDANKIPAGATLYLPQKMADGSTTYHYANKASINSNPANGEYHMVVPDGQGGQVVYSRKFLGDVDGVDGKLQAQYEVNQTHIDKSGAEVFSFNGQQVGRDGELIPASAAWQNAQQSGTSTFDDDVRLDLVKDKASGKTTLSVTDEDSGKTRSEEVKVGAAAGKTPEQRAAEAQNAMYSDMAGFVNALRGKDKVNQLLYAAKIGINYQISQGNTNPSLQSLNKDVAALGAVVGVVAGLRAMRSGDTKTQIGGAVGLVSSANMLYAYANTGTVAAGGGFLTLEQAGALQLVGAAISISNLKHLDEMIDNGQYGTAMATLYGAYVGGVAVYTAATAGLSAVMATAAFTGPVGLFVAMGAIALDSMFSEDPPPPPPLGDATFRRNAQGQLVWDYGSQSNNLGRSVLAPHMQAMAAKLKTYVDESNKGVTDADRQFVLLASRLPKVYIQSWPSHTDNGKTNFFFALEYKHPQTGEKIYATVARDDLDSDYAAYTVMPEALVQRWQVATMSGRFGANESQWLTEGQWTNGNSATEQQRAQLNAQLQAAQTALNDAKQTHLKLVGTQVVADGAVGAGVAQAEQKLKSALAALQMFAAEHPQNGDTAARIVDSTLVANMQILKASDPEEYLKAYNLVRDKTSQQWMKVIALDWDGDGKVAHLAALQNAGTDLKSLQSDGATRFDVDGDGYREVTEWINPSDAMLGIDLDGDGVIGNSRELFNGTATAFDQRGWGSLKYYDSNKDNKIDRSDAVFKLLRLWVDINGDGTAGTMETLQQLKVQSIDLSTMKFKLADGLVKDCRSRCRVRALFVKGHNTRRQKIANTSTARLLGCAI